MAEKHLLQTGPTVGEVVLADGSRVDVTASVLELDTFAEVVEIAHAIGLARRALGEFYDDSHYIKHRVQED